MKQVIDREKLTDKAYAIASHEGVPALSIQRTAAACDIAVDSVYAYFPTKAEFTAAILKRLFIEMSFEEHCAAREGESFTSCLRRFHDALSEAIVMMNADWLVQVRRLPDSECCVLEIVHVPMMTHMERGPRHALDADDAVVRVRLAGVLHSESLCRFTLHSILTSSMEDGDCGAFFAFLGTALHADAALYAGATLYTDSAPSIGAILYIDAETPL